MGTINYRTSDYITMGALPYECYECGECSERLCEADDYFNAKCKVEEYTNNLQFFNVDIEFGYYEGFSIKIEYDGYEFADMEEKRRAKEEAEEVGECLRKLADIGMVACFPSWCTSYADYNRTLELIADAVEAMKEDVRMTNVDRYAWEV